MQVSVERCSTVQVKEEKKAGEWGRNNFILSFWIIRYLKLNSGALDWATCYCIQQYSLEKVMHKSWYYTLFFYDIFLNTVPELPINVIYVKRVRLWRSTFTFFEHFFCHTIRRFASKGPDLGWLFLNFGQLVPHFRWLVPNFGLTRHRIWLTPLELSLSLVDSTPTVLTSRKESVNSGNEMTRAENF